MKDGTWVKVIDVEIVHLDVGVECARKVGRRHLADRVRPSSQLTTLTYRGSIGQYLVESWSPNTAQFAETAHIRKR
jgi:hypothetical protein